MDCRSLMSPAVLAAKPSGIRRFFDLAAGMDGVISLGVGEPDFQTPWHIRQAGIASLEQGKTKYTANKGMKPLLEEISAYLHRRFALDYDPASELTVTVGGSEAIDIAMRAFLEPGDEVLLPEPSFVCYSPLASFCGAKVIPLPCRPEDGFKLRPGLIKEKITPKTKMLVLPFPNNPTGAILTRPELAEIAQILRGTDIVVLSDEIYGELTYPCAHTSAASAEGMRERTLLVGGFSKSYAMTGWRLGYVAAPREISEQLTKLHQFAIMCAPTTSQYAAVEALRNGDGDIAAMRAEYDMRRRLLVGTLRSIGMECSEPDGAFYAFPRIDSFGLTGEQFCERLLTEQKVAIVPGDAFGESGRGFARISYSYSVSHLITATERIEKFINSL